MIKKILATTALMTLVGCSTFSPSKCETTACKTADIMAKRLNELASQEIQFNDAIALGRASADDEVVNVTMYITGPMSDKFRQAVEENPGMDKKLKGDMQAGVTQQNCGIPAFRKFLEAGGELNYEIRYQDNQDLYHQIEIVSCNG